MKGISQKTIYCCAYLFFFAGLVTAQVTPNRPQTGKRVVLDSITVLTSKNSILLDSIDVLHDSLSLITRSMLETKQAITLERERNLKREAELVKIIEKLDGTDWPSILIGGAIAIVATLITLLFQYWHRIRNRLFPEFTIQINHDQTHTVNDLVVSAEFSVVMFSASPEKVRINYVYLEVPTDIKINAPSFSSLADKMFGHPGRFYLNQFESKQVDGILYEKISIVHQAILILINEGKLSKFVIHVHTSKYGSIKSLLK